MITLQDRANVLTRQMTELLGMISQEMEALQTTEERLKDISLTSKQAASIIGVTSSYFDNVKSTLIKRGWFKDGVFYPEVIELARWAKTNALKNAPNKNTPLR